MLLETVKKLISNSRQISLRKQPEDNLIVYRTMPRITFEDAVTFIRSHHELPGWTDEEIKYELALASKNAALAYSTDGRNNLTGICFGEWQEQGTVFFCHCIIAPKQLPTYVDYIKVYFPQCKKIAGMRAFGTITLEYDINNLSIHPSKKA